MSFELRDLWRKERSRGFAGLAGSRVSGRVPIRQALVDERLRRWQKPASVDAVRVVLRSGNLLQLSAVLVVFGFRKRVETTVRVAPAVQLQGRPTLHLFFVRPTLLSTVASFVTPLLTSGISVTRDAVAIDLRELLGRVQCDDLLQHVRAVALEGHEGVMWLNIDVEVADASPSPIDPFAQEAGAGDVPSRVEEALSMFAGAELAVTLRIHETLATEVAEAVFDRMQQVGERDAPAGPTMSTVVGTPRVRFEPHFMVMDTHVRL